MRVTIFRDMSKRGFTNDHTYSASKCIECEFCHQNFENLEQLMSHFVSDHSKVTKSFICVLCDRTFVSTVLLRKHMDLHKDAESHEIFCDICEDRFKTDDDLHRHLDSHTVIRGVFSSMKSFHSFKCLFCRSGSNTRKTFSFLRQHELKKHLSELNFVCNVGNCKEPFSHLYLLEAHKVCHLPEPTNQDTTTTTMTTATTYPCLVCNYQFDTVKALKYHHLIHLDFLERCSRLNYKKTLEMELFCKKCGKAFIQREDVKLHACHSTPLRCELCPEYYFTERPHLVNHIIEKHETISTPNNKMYRCFKPNCAKRFVTDFMYKRHLRYHHLSRCPLCEFGIKESKYSKKDIKSKIKSHMTSCHAAAEGEDSKCTVCLKQFCTPLTSVVHLRKHHPEIFTFICTICDKTYSSLEQLNAHTLSHNTGFTDAEGTTQDLQMFECYCSNSFISVNTFQDHLESHTGEGLLICELCVSHNRLAPSLFHGIENLQKHTEREHSSAGAGTPKDTPWESIDFDALIEENFPSSTCSLSLSSLPTTISSTLSSSQSLPQIENKEDVIMMDAENDFEVADNSVLPSKSVKCEVCDKTLRDSTALRLHQHTHPELFIYKCPEANCDSKFVSEIHLFTHAQIHSYIPDESLICYCCSKSRTFETKEDLAKHLRIHTQDKKKTCPHCHKVLHNTKHLADHIANIHKMILFRCTDCNLTFTTKGNLIRHQNCRHSTSNETFDCAECPKKYRSKAMLYCHRREVHNPIMQQCDQCGEMIASCKFKMHLLKAHGVDTFKHIKASRALTRCYFCSQQFSSLVHLEFHMTSHTNERNTLIKIPPEKGRRTQNPPSSLIDCKICGKQFQRIYTYNMHMNFHNGVRKIKCSVCSKTFSNYLSRAGHQLSHRTLNPQEINKNKETKAFAKTWTSFTCKFCRKVFTVRTQYQYHLNQHTGK